MTDVAITEQLLRIIQSIPSPKTEPFKLWLAEVGRERIEKTRHHQLSFLADDLPESEGRVRLCKLRGGIRSEGDWGAVDLY